MKTKKTNWKKLILSFIQIAKDEGLTLMGACDGEEGMNSTCARSCAQHIANCDEGNLYFFDKDLNKNLWVFIMLGNEPCEMITDYVCNAKLDAASDKFIDKYE